MSRLDRAWLGLALVVVLALALRLTGIEWGLPTKGRYLSWNPDEGTFTTMLYHMDPYRLNLNPGEFGVPSFTPYALAGGLVVGKVLGLVEVRPDKAYYVAHLEQWGRVFLTGRLISVLFAALSVVAIYALIRRLYPGRRWLPFLGAALLAVAPGHVAWSHYLSQNPLVTFWVLVAFYFLMALVEQPGERHYVLAGLCSGIACSTNYNALLLLPLLPLAHVLAGSPHEGWRAWFAPPRLKWLLLAGLAAVVGFVVVTPYSILDFPTFQQRVLWVNSNLAGGLEDVGLIETARRLFLEVLPATIGWGPYLLGLAGVAWTVVNRRRRPAEWLSLVFLLLFALAVSRSGHRLAVGRLLPLGVIALLPAVGLAGALWQRGGRDAGTERRGDAGTRGRMIRWGVAVLVLLALVTALVPALAVDVYFLQDTVRSEASAWIQAHIPRGATVGTIHEPWYFTPDILGLDYFHPEATGGLYRYQVYRYNDDRLRDSPADWIVIASQEAGPRLEDSAEPTKAAFRERLAREYRWAAWFMLDERLGWAGPVLESQPALFGSLWPAPDAWVYQHDVR
mgnify:CR=1 FL=1